MNELHIGDFVKRNTPNTKWHDIESVVAGAAVTRCGRRLEPVIASGAELLTRVTTPEPEERCSRC